MSPNVDWQMGATAKDAIGGGRHKDKGCGIMRRLFTSAGKHAFLNHRTTRACYGHWRRGRNLGTPRRNADNCGGGEGSD